MGSAYYRAHLSITAGSLPPGSATWTVTETSYGVSPSTYTFTSAGTATVSQNLWLARTTASQSLPFTGGCQEGFVCPLDGLQNIRRSGDTLTITRQAALLYIDGINPAWPAHEVATFVRTMP
jgi:hypothetical protein